MTATANPSTAVIYCRVSSNRQVKQGHGLESQESRCREFAAYRGYQIAETFRDEGVSGSLVDRPGMKQMLAWLRKRRADNCAVIIDDISRLARGIDAHRTLRAAIGSVGAKLESPSIEFGDDSDSLLVENIRASVSQHQREKNAEQVVHRMTARLRNGYYVFASPTGYRYEHVTGRGKLLRRDEPIASVLQEALEGYASGRFQTQAEVARFLNPHPVFARDVLGNIRLQQIKCFLTNPVYGGHFEYKPWEVRLTKGVHEPLISWETFQRIQERLEEKAHAPIRKDIKDDFPLRGFVTCAACDHPMTAYWAKGRNKHYAYYQCFKKGCVERGKAIAREKVETAFEALLRQMRPSANLVAMAAQMFRDLWEQRIGSIDLQKAEQRKALKAYDRQISKVMDRLIDTESPNAVRAYESKLEKLESDKAIMRENIANSSKPMKDFDKSFRTAMAFLANPCNLWVSDRLEDRRAVLRLVFAAPLPYARNEGFRTAKTPYLSRS